MTQLFTEQLHFRPASEKPTADLNGLDVLVFNPCDGWHIGQVMAFEEDGEIYDIGIYEFPGHEYAPHEFYIAWAVLPDSLPLRDQFIDQKGSRWAFECLGRG